jgi:hypothetical protein
VLRSKEICDGLDNDCDGSIDELGAKGTQLPCGEGACAGGFTMCATNTSTIVCSTAGLATPEVCDWADNDCDGEVDEDVIDEGELCYDGPVEETLYGACRSGITLCSQGRLVCAGQILPTEELCDTLDNNCDGLVDNIEIPTNELVPNIDVVFVVDRSGSMNTYTQNVQSHLRAWFDDIATSTTSSVAVHMIDLPEAPNTSVWGPNGDCHGTEAVFPTDPCALEDFSNAIDQLSYTFGGIELSYDVLYEVPDLVNWRTNSYRFVVFLGDEPGQTYERRSVEELLVRLQQAGISLIAFVQIVEDYRRLAEDTGGAVARLSGAPISSVLGDVAKAPCR